MSTIERAAFAGLSLHDYKWFEETSQQSIAFTAQVFDETTGEFIGTLTNEGGGEADVFREDSPAGFERWSQAQSEFEPLDEVMPEQALASALSGLSAIVADFTYDMLQDDNLGFILGEPRDVVSQDNLDVYTVPDDMDVETGVAAVLAEQSLDETLVYGVIDPEEGAVNVFVARGGESAADEGNDSL